MNFETKITKNRGNCGKIMSDPLELLRQFTIDNKEIKERDDKIIFDEIGWNKNTLTNFIITYGKGDIRRGKEYYSLSCLLYFLKKYDLDHPDYIKEAEKDKMSNVRRPDRRALLDYLHGVKKEPPKNIDKTANIDKPIHISSAKSEVKKEPSEDLPLVSNDASSNASCIELEKPISIEKPVESVKVERLEETNIKLENSEKNVLKRNADSNDTLIDRKKVVKSIT